MPLRTTNLRQIGIAAVLSLTASAAGQTTAVVVTSGQAPPDGVGVFSSGFTAFSSPALNEAGQVAFRSVLTGSGVTSANDQGIYRTRGDGLTQIVRRGQAVPDGVGLFSGLDNPSLNNPADGIGQAAFAANLTGTGVTTANNRGIFRGDGITLTQIARSGQAVPDGIGVFAGGGFAFSAPAFNNGGQVAFAGNLTGTGVTSANDRGIFRGDGTTLTQIVRKGQAAPDGVGVFSTGGGTPSLNNPASGVGQVAFNVSLTGDGVTAANNQAVYRGDGGALTQIARGGQAAPDGVGVILGFVGLPVLNNAGQTAVSNTFTGTGVTSANDRGILRGDGTTPTQIVRTGQTAPDGMNVISGLLDPVLNNNGQAAFFAALAGTGVTTANDRVLFRGDGGTLTQIVRKGQAAPDGPGVFSALVSPALNDAGQAAFLADLSGDGVGVGNNQGLFFFDDTLGLLTVARRGDALPGGTITGLSFNDGSGALGTAISGLNNLGQVAYTYSLSNGTRGVAIYTIPEPSAVALLAVAAGGLLRRRRIAKA